MTALTIIGGVIIYFCVKVVFGVNPSTLRTPTQPPLYDINEECEEDNFEDCVIIELLTMAWKYYLICSCEEAVYCLNEVYSNNLKNVEI